MVLAAAAGAGVGLRELQHAEGTEGSSAAGALSGVPSLPPGVKTVALAADVQAHPAADRVHALLQDYFDAINEGDYQLWSSTVTAQQARDTSRSAFRDRYRTTVDSSILVHRLEPRPGGGLIALISFTSVQDPTDAPSDLRLRCLRWWVSYPLVSEADELRLGLAPPSASLRAPC